MNRLLIFGGGFVGGHLARAAQRQGWDVTIADNFHHPGLDTVPWKTVDITQPEAVAEVFDQVQPQAVVNVAAIADIDRAEKERDLAWSVNVVGARLLAENCAARGAKYIFFSSDAVFDGHGQGYTEEDAPAPVNYYGVTKAEAEKAVLSACPNAAVIRISLVLGFPMTGGNSFFSALETKLKQGKEVMCPPGEIRTPVDVLTLSECILELARGSFSGRLHIGALDSIGRYELTRQIARRLGYDETLVKVQDSTAGQPGRAPRHQNGICNVTKAQRLLSTKLLSTDEGIRRAIQERPSHFMEDAAQKPKVVHELEISYGTAYGYEEAIAVLECLQNLAPSCGKKVKQFEEEFAKYCGVRYALAVNNATSGLTLAGIAAGIKPGDEVITTPVTWISTASAYSVLGAKMVFCDVDPRSLNLDSKKLEAKITPPTKAIVPVHLYGQCCEMDAIMAVAKKHNLVVIEDCAHNPGGEYLGKKAGALGHMGVFSFHQQKNMSTLGEGGMVTTDSQEFYCRVMSYRSLCCRAYDPKGKYLPVDLEKHPMNHEYWRLFFDDHGYNCRLTDVQGAVGLEQLKKLDRFNARRIAIAKRLTEKLQGIRGLTLPCPDPRGKHVFHIYVVQLEPEFPLSKREFMWTLYTQKGIKTWSHYMPVHLTDPYVREGHHPGECPVAEAAFNKYVSLPIHPRLTDEAVDYMARSILEISKQSQKRS